MGQNLTRDCIQHMCKASPRYSTQHIATNRQRSTYCPNLDKRGPQKTPPLVLQNENIASFVSSRINLLEYLRSQFKLEQVNKFESKYTLDTIGERVNQFPNQIRNICNANYD